MFVCTYACVHACMYDQIDPATTLTFKLSNNCPTIYFYRLKVLFVPRGSIVKRINGWNYSLAPNEAIVRRFSYTREEASKPTLNASSGKLLLQCLS